MMTTLRARANRHSTRSIDRALVRVRILVGLAALLLAGHAFVRSQNAASMLGIVAAATVIAFVPGERALRRLLGVLRTSVVVASIDTLAVIALLGLTDAHSGDPTSLLLVLPLVQAGVRHGTLGAFMAWFAAAAAIMIQTIAEWNGTPGQVTGPIVFIVILLFISLPSAALGDRLAERMHEINQFAARIEARSDVLADVLDASITITSAPADRRTAELVEQARRLIRCDADVVAFDNDLDGPIDAVRHDPAALLHDIDGRQMIRIPIGGTPAMVLTASTDSIDDIFAVEAVQLLAITARTLAAADVSRHLDVDATVEVQRFDAGPTIPVPTSRPVRLSELLPASDPDVYDRPGIERHLSERLDQGMLTQLALVSLDNLKLINDLDGRDAGNALIAAVGRRLSAVATTVAIAWLGGDEFLVLGSVADSTTSLSTEIRRALETRVDIGTARPTAIHASVGVAFGSGGETAPQLVRQARETMFADKRKQNLEFLDQVEVELATHFAGMP